MRRSSAISNIHKDTGTEAEDVLRKRRIYLPNYSKSNHLAIQERTESLHLLVNLLQYLNASLLQATIDPNLLFLVNELTTLLPDQASEATPSQMDSLMETLVTALTHQEPLVRGHFLHLLCCHKDVLKTVFRYSGQQYTQRLCDCFVNEWAGGTEPWNRLRALDTLSLAIPLLKKHDDLLISLFWRIASVLRDSLMLIREGHNEATDVEWHYHSIARLFQCLVALCKTPCTGIKREIGVFVSLVQEGLNSDSELLQLVNLRALNQLIVPKYGRFVSDFVERVKFLSQSKNTLIQTAAFQFITDRLKKTQAGEQTSGFARVRATTNMLRSMMRLDTQKMTEKRRKSLKRALYRDPASTLDLPGGAQGRNRILRDLLRIPQTYARCKAQVGESSSTDPGTALSVFSCHTVRLRHTTDLRICIPSLSESAEMEVTVSIDVPHLPGIPAGGTSIPFTFDPHLGSRNFSREVLDKDNVDAPVSFMRSTTAPTLTLPPNMTFDEPVGDSPRSSVASCPRGFKTVQPIQGMVDPRWKCPSRPQTPDFDEEHFLLLSPPLRQPMASHSWMKRVSNVKQLAVDFHVNGMITIEMDPVGANAESFEASAYKARIVSMGDEIDAEDTESLQKTTEELVERAPRDLRVGTALGMLVCSKHTQKWKLLKLRIESEIDIWAIDAQEQFANAMRAVVPAGFDRTSGKLCFYPPAVIPPFPVDHTESGEPLYQGLPSLKPTPAGYTAENRPYYNIPSQEEQAVSDAVDASPGIHTFLAGYSSEGAPFFAPSNSILPRPSGFTEDGVPYYLVSWLYDFVQKCSSGEFNDNDAQVEVEPDYDVERLRRDGDTFARDHAITSLAYRDDIICWVSDSTMSFSATSHPQKKTLKIRLEQLISSSAAQNLEESGETVPVLVFLKPFDVFHSPTLQLSLEFGKMHDVEISFDPAHCTDVSSYIEGSLELLDLQGSPLAEIELTAFRGPWLLADTSQLSALWCETGTSRVAPIALQNLSATDTNCKLSIEAMPGEVEGIEEAFLLEETELILPSFTEISVDVIFGPTQAGVHSASLFIETNEHENVSMLLRAQGGSQISFASNVGTTRQRHQSIFLSAKLQEFADDHQEENDFSSDEEELGDLIEEGDEEEEEEVSDEMRKLLEGAPLEQGEDESLSEKAKRMKRKIERRKRKREAAAKAKATATISKNLVGIDFGIVQPGDTYRQVFQVGNKMGSDSIVMTECSSDVFFCSKTFHEMSGQSSVNIDIELRLPTSDSCGWGDIYADLDIYWPDDCSTRVPVHAFIGTPIIVQSVSRALFPPSELGEEAQLCCRIVNISPYELKWRFMFTQPLQQVEFPDNLVFGARAAPVPSSSSNGNVKGKAKEQNVDGVGVKGYEPFWFTSAASACTDVQLLFRALRVGPEVAHIRIVLDVERESSYASGINDTVIELVGFGLSSARLKESDFVRAECWFERSDSFALSESPNHSEFADLVWPYDMSSAAEISSELSNELTFEFELSSSNNTHYVPLHLDPAQQKCLATDALIMHARREDGGAELHEFKTFAGNGITVAHDAIVKHIAQLDVHMNGPENLCMPVHGFITALNIEKRHFCSVAITGGVPFPHAFVLHPRLDVMDIGQAYAGKTTCNRPLRVFNLSDTKARFTAHLVGSDNYNGSGTNNQSPHDQEFSILPESGVIDSLQSIEFRVRYEPKIPGDSSTRVQLLFEALDDGNSAASADKVDESRRARFSIIVTGKAMLSELSGVPRSLEFGSVPIGLSAIIETPISNEGAEPQRILVNATPPFRTLNTIVEVPARGKVSLVFIYKPQKSGRHPSSIFVKAGSSLVRIAAHAQGGSLELTCEPSPPDNCFDMGTHSVGTQATLYLLLANRGTLPLHIPPMQLGGKQFRATGIKVVRRSFNLPEGIKTRPDNWSLLKSYLMTHNNELPPMGPKNKRRTTVVLKLLNKKQNEKVVSGFMVPALQALYVRVVFRAAHQGKFESSFNISYNHGDIRKKRLDSSRVLYLQNLELTKLHQRFISEEDPIPYPKQVESILESGSAMVPPSKLIYTISGNSTRSLRISPSDLDFGLVAITRSGASQASSRRRASVLKVDTKSLADHDLQRANDDPSLDLHNVREVMIVNHSLEVQKLDVKKIRPKVFQAKLDTYHLKPGHIMKLPVSFTPTIADSVSIGSLLVEHHFGECLIPLRGVGAISRVSVVSPEKSFKFADVVSDIESRLPIELCNRGTLEAIVTIQCLQRGSFGLRERTSPVNEDEEEHIGELRQEIQVAVPADEKPVTFYACFISNLDEAQNCEVMVQWYPHPGAVVKQQKLKLFAKVGSPRLELNMSELHMPVALLGRVNRRPMILCNKGDSTGIWKTVVRTSSGQGADISNKLRVEPSSGVLKSEAEQTITVVFEPDAIELFRGSIAFSAIGHSQVETVFVSARVTVPELNFDDRQLEADLGILRVRKVFTHNISITNTSRSCAVVIIIPDETEDDEEIDENELEMALHEKTSTCARSETAVPPIRSSVFEISRPLLFIDPEETSEIRIQVVPVEPGVSSKLTLHVVSGLVAGDEYFPLEFLHSFVSCTAGSAVLEVEDMMKASFVEDASRINSDDEQEIEAWTDDERLNQVIRGNRPTGIASTLSCVNAGLMVLGDSVVLKDSLLFHNTGNMDLRFEIETLKGHHDNTTDADDVVAFEPKEGGLAAGSSVNIQVTVTANMKGFLQQRFEVSAVSWNQRFPLLVMAVADDVLLSSKQDTIDFGVCQINKIHSQSLQLCSDGRFSFGVRLHIERNTEMEKTKSLEREQQRIEDLVKGDSDTVADRVNAQRQAEVESCFPWKGHDNDAANNNQVEEDGSDSPTESGGGDGDGSGTGPPDAAAIFGGTEQADILDQIKSMDAADEDVVCPFKILPESGEVQAMSSLNVEVQYCPKELSGASRWACFRVVVEWKGEPLYVNLNAEPGDAELQISLIDASDTGAAPKGDTTPTLPDFGAEVDMGVVEVDAPHNLRFEMFNVGSLPFEYETSVLGDFLRIVKEDESASSRCYLPIGEKAFVNVVAEPTSSDLYEGSLLIQSDELGERCVSIRCRGGTLVFWIEGNLNFGQVPLGLSRSRTITIHNTGELSANFLLTEEIGLEAFEVTTESLFVEAGTSASFQMSLRHDEAAMFYGVLNVYPDRGQAEKHTRQLEVNAETLLMSIQISSESNADLGIVTVEEQAKLTRTLTNTTKSTLSFEVRCKALNADPQVWSMFPAKADLPPGENVDVEFVFTANRSALATALMSGSNGDRAMRSNVSSAFVVEFSVYNTSVKAVDAKFQVIACIGQPQLLAFLQNISHSLAHDETELPPVSEKDVISAAQASFASDELYLGRYKLGCKGGARVCIANKGAGRLDYEIELVGDRSDFILDSQTDDATVKGSVLAIPKQDSSAENTESLDVEALMKTMSLHTITFCGNQEGDFSVLVRVRTKNRSGASVMTVRAGASAFALDEIQLSYDIGSLAMGEERTLDLVFVNRAPVVNRVVLAFDEEEAPARLYVVDDEEELDEDNKELMQKVGSVKQSGSLVSLQPRVLRIQPCKDVDEEGNLKGIKESASLHVAAHIRLDKKGVAEPASIIDTLRILCPDEAPFQQKFSSNSLPLRASTKLFVSSLAFGQQSINISYSLQIHALHLSASFLKLPTTLTARPTQASLSVHNLAAFPLPFKLRPTCQYVTCVPNSGILKPGRDVLVEVRFLSLEVFDSDIFFKRTGNPVQIICDSLPDVFESHHVQLHIHCKDFCFKAQYLTPLKFEPLVLEVSEDGIEYVKLQNVSENAVETRVYFASDSDFQVMEQFDEDFTITPGETVDVGVVFSPKAPGHCTDMLIIETVLGKFELEVSGEAFEPRLNVSTTKLDFGVVASDCPVERTALLSNPCPIPFTLECPSTHSEFTWIREKHGNVDSDLASNEDSDDEEETDILCVLEPKESVVFRVRYTPKRSKRRSTAEHCLFHFYHTGSPVPLAEIMCVGKSGQIHLDISKGILQFGRIPHQSAMTSQFTVENRGDVPLRLAIMSSDGTEPVDTIENEKGWIKFKPHELTLHPGDEESIHVLVQSNVVGFVMLSFRIGLLGCVTEKFWYMKIQMHGDQIVLSTQTKSAMRDSGLQCVSMVELFPNQHVLDVVRVEDRIHSVSIAHDLVMLEPTVREQNYDAVLKRPPPIAHEIVNSVRSWYATRSPLRMTRIGGDMDSGTLTTESNANMMSQFEQMLSPVEHRRHPSSHEATNDDNNEAKK